MDGEKRGQEVRAADGGSAVNNDRPPDSQQALTEPANESVSPEPKKWSRNQKLTVATIVFGLIGAVVAAGIPLLLSGGGSGGSRSTCQDQIQINKNNGPIEPCSTINNNYGPTASSGPQAQVVQQTGSFSDKGFADAIFGRDTGIVALYLKAGMNAATLYDGTSAILFGFESVDQNGDPIQNGDPVALIKTFQAAGFSVNDELKDSYLMGSLTGNLFPLQFHTKLAPKGYTGGYQNGTFVGSLLFWVVQRALGTGLAGQDLPVIKYLISQGADCKVTLSFMDYNRDLLNGLSTYTYKELLPMVQNCAK